MLKKLIEDQKGGATLDYAVFMCVAALVLVGSIAYFGDQYRETLLAEQQTNEIDRRYVGSIRQEEQSINGNRAYRLFDLPAELQRTQQEK